MPVPIRVILADDLPQIRNVLRRILERDARFEVVAEAVDGVEALAVASSLRPDAIVLDLSMPKLGGMEAIPQILDASPGTKIVVLSGSLEKAADARDAGAHAFFDKTAASQHLAATIVKLVGENRQLPPSDVRDN